METRQFEVAIVGAGPGGLAAAVTLGEHGVSTLVVERRTSPSPLPRANAASTGTMELLRRWGLERRVRERALDVEFRAWATPSLTAGTGEAVDVGFPSREQAMLVSPTAPAAIGQDDLEPLLEARARSFASVRVERGAELLGLDADNDGYTLTVRDPSAGAKPVRARYVIGADGMHSAVREPARHRDHRLGRSRDAGGSPFPRPALGAALRAAPCHLLPHRRLRRPGVHPRRKARPMGVRHEPGSCRGGRARTRASPSRRGGRARSRDRDRPGDAGDLRHQPRRALPGGRRVSDRRRRASGHPPGRDRSQHSHPRRLRHRVETRLGPARLGRPGAARQLRARTATGGGVQHAAVEPRGRLAARESASGSARTSAAASPTSGWRGASDRCPPWICSARASRSSPGPSGRAQPRPTTRTHRPSPWSVSTQSRLGGSG